MSNEPFSPERLKEAMSGMSNVDLANKLGCSRSNISMYLTGSRTPNKMTIHLMSICLGVSPAWLMGFDVDKFVSGTEPTIEARRIAKAFDKATAKEQEMVRLTLSEYLDETTAAAPPQTPLPPEAEAELANYRRELEAEQKGKTSYPTAEENGA